MRPSGEVICDGRLLRLAARAEQRVHGRLERDREREQRADQARGALGVVDEVARARGLQQLNSQLARGPEVLGMRQRLFDEVAGWQPRSEMPRGRK